MIYFRQPLYRLMCQNRARIKPSLLSNFQTVKSAQNVRFLRKNPDISDEARFFRYYFPWLVFPLFGIGIYTIYEYFNQPKESPKPIKDKNVKEKPPMTEVKEAPIVKEEEHVEDVESKETGKEIALAQNEKIEKTEEEVRRSPNGIPDEIPYLIIGGGTASFAAFRAIKARDARAKVLIISEEDFLPYMKPPLSKEMWYGDSITFTESEITFKSYSGRERNLFFEKGAFFNPPDTLEFNPKGGISVLKGRKVVELDAESQIASLDDGRKIKYGKCLIATGGRPRTLEALDCLGRDHVSTFKSVRDFVALEELINSGKVKSVAIIGSGLLGTELSHSLSVRGKKKGLKVMQIFPEAGILRKILPEYLSNWATNRMKKDGIEVHPNTMVKSAKVENGQVVLSVDNGEDIRADHVIVSIGITPNTQLAESAGLSLDLNDGGFSVNSQLESNKKNIFVAGDAASYFCPLLGRQIRAEHHDNATATGKLAGENMAGAGKEMSVQQMFWSDLGLDYALEATGEIDSSMQTVGIYTKDEEKGEYDRGVVFYLNKQEVVVGVLLWNIFNHLSVARRIVRENRKFEDLSEVAKHFNMYKSMLEEDEEVNKTDEDEK